MRESYGRGSEFELVVETKKNREHPRGGIAKYLFLPRVQIKQRYDREFTIPVVFGFIQRHDVKTNHE